MCNSPLRIALVSEGITDYVVICAALESIIAENKLGSALIVTQLQPEPRFLNGNAGDFGGGWVGVFNWCRQKAEDELLLKILFSQYDVIIMHLDWEVCKEKPDEHRSDQAWLCSFLPCDGDKDDLETMTAALEAVLLRAMKCESVPEKMCFCFPALNSDTWVLASLDPNNKYMEKSGWEKQSPLNQMKVLPREKRVKKSKKDYEGVKHRIISSWPTLCTKLSQAIKFQSSFLAVVGER